MPDNIYKLIELTGTSSSSIEAAIDNAIAKASKTIHHMRWFQVAETRGTIEDGKVTQWQVTIKAGFRLED
jgi:dodecin